LWYSARKVELILIKYFVVHTFINKTVKRIIGFKCHVLHWSKPNLFCIVHSLPFFHKGGNK
jgi:hypothetical protein